jgi:hypothetical protein
MARFELQKLYIDGGYVDASSDATFEAINPANGEVLAKVQRASQADVERAVASAEKGQKIWAALTAMERSRILRRAVDILRERNDELAALETLDTGKPISAKPNTSTSSPVPTCWSTTQGWCTAIEGEQIPLRTSSFVYTRREPLGVVGIGAWNYPIQIALWKSAPALAAGNAMIFKPSEVTSLTTLALAEIYTEAGLPGWRVQRADRQTAAKSAPGTDRAPAHREDLVHWRHRHRQESHGQRLELFAEGSDHGTGRQVAADHLRRRRSGSRRRHGDDGQLLQLRSGLHQRHPRVRAAVHLKAASNQDRSSASNASASATRKTRTPTSARWSASPTWKACWATSKRQGRRRASVAAASD